MSGHIFVTGANGRIGQHLIKRLILEGETVVASAIWHFEPTLDAAIAAVKAGNFTAADYGVYSFMKEGGASLAPFGTFEGKIPQEALDLIAERTKAIKAGEYTVEINDEEPKSS